MEGLCRTWSCVREFTCKCKLPPRVAGVLQARLSLLTPRVSGCLYLCLTDLKGAVEFVQSLAADSEIVSHYCTAQQSYCMMLLHSSVCNSTTQQSCTALLHRHATAKQRCISITHNPVTSPHNGARGPQNSAVPSLSGLLRQLDPLFAHAPSQQQNQQPIH